MVLDAASERGEAIGKYVGVNCDLSHWELAEDLHYRQLTGSEAATIRRRVVHAHATKQHRAGHLGDLRLVKGEDEMRLREWVQFIRGCYERNESDLDGMDANSLPKPSNCVSLELEGSCSLEWARSSLEVLEEVVKERRS